jgi:hypothetical protein
MMHAALFAFVRDKAFSVEKRSPHFEDSTDPIDVSFEEADQNRGASRSEASSSGTKSTLAMATSRARATREESATVEQSLPAPTDSSMPLVDLRETVPRESRGLVRPLPGNENAGDDGAWTFRATRDIDLKLGDKTGSLGRQMAANGQLDLPPKKSVAGMSEGLDAIDVAKGFGRAGGVVQAIEAVVRDPSAPPEGVAFFDVSIEKNGNISVSVSEATNDRESWERLTSAIASSLKTKDVRFPEQGKGLKVGVRVEAKVRYPDGRDPKKNGAYAGATGLKAHTDKDGLVIDELPSIGVGVRGKVCSGGISLGLTGPSIAGGCSPENIGTHPERTVAAHETYEQRM